jgi:protein gp37
LDLTGIDWLIVGGESGRRARPMELDWARSLVRQCQDARVPVFVKQLGSSWSRDHHDIDQFPTDLRVRQYPEVPAA